MIPIEQLVKNEKNPDLRNIAKKIIDKQRINEEEGMLLFEHGSLPFLGALANPWWRDEQLRALSNCPQRKE